MWLVRNASLIVCSSFVFCIGNNVLAQPKDNYTAPVDILPFVSEPADRFTIGIPTSWKTHVLRTEGGRSYVFQAPGTSYALSVAVRAPNSLAPLLYKIQNEVLTANELSELQGGFRELAPEKLNLRLFITEIGNQQALTQSYTAKHTSAGYTGFLAGKEYQFLYREKQYIVGYSVAAWSVEDSERMFDEVERRLFQPILFSLFLN